MNSSSDRARLGHTAEDPYVPPEHTYRLARSLAWTTLAASWIMERREDPA